LYIIGLSEWEFWKTLKFEKSEFIYAYISEKKANNVNIADNRTIWKNLTPLKLNINLENIKIELSPTAITKLKKPTRELIYILYSSNLIFQFLF